MMPAIARRSQEGITVSQSLSTNEIDRQTSRKQRPPTKTGVFHVEARSEGFTVVSGTDAIHGLHEIVFAV